VFRLTITASVDRPAPLLDQSTGVMSDKPMCTVAPPDGETLHLLSMSKKR